MVTTRSKVISDYLSYITSLNNCTTNCSLEKNGTVYYMATYSDDIKIGSWDYSVENTNGNAWTESSWSIIKLSTFTSRTKSDYILVSIGFVCMIIFTIYTYIFMKKLHI